MSAITLTRSAVRQIFLGGLREVMARPMAQALGLADVEHLAQCVLHEIDAGRGGKIA